MQQSSWRGQKEGDKGWSELCPPESIKAGNPALELSYQPVLNCASGSNHEAENPLKSTGQTDAQPGYRPVSKSAQTRDVIRHRFDFAIIHFCGHLGHLKVVLANTFTELNELGSGVLSMLACKTGIL